MVLLLGHLELAVDKLTSLVDLIRPEEDHSNPGEIAKLTEAGDIRLPPKLRLQAPY